MNGLSSILHSLDSTQRTKESLLLCSPCISQESVPSVPPPFYSSPLDRPTAEPCFSDNCKKQSGTLNENQSLWISKMIKSALNEGSCTDLAVLHNPPISRWDKKPNLNDYLLKPLYIIHPEVQYALDICGGKCPSCNSLGSLKFKQFSAPRVIECLDTVAYAVEARYECKLKPGGCGKTINVMDEQAVSMTGLIPIEVQLNYPIVLFQQSGYSTTLVQSIFDLTTGRAGASDCVKMIRCARTTKFMKDASLWRAHVSDWIKRQKRLSALLQTDLPSFLQ